MIRLLLWLDSDAGMFVFGMGLIALALVGLGAGR